MCVEVVSYYIYKLLTCIQGTRDATVHPKYANQISVLLPSGAKQKLITLDGAGHDLSVSHHEEVAAALLDLLDGKSWKKLP